MSFPLGSEPPDSQLDLKGYNEWFKNNAPSQAKSRGDYFRRKRIWDARHKKNDAEARSKFESGNYITYEERRVGV